MRSESFFRRTAVALALVALLALSVAGFLGAFPEPPWLATRAAGEREPGGPEASAVGPAARTTRSPMTPSPALAATAAATFGARATPAPIEARATPSATEPASSLAELEPAYLELDSYSIRAGEPIALRGGGFLPGERLRVYLSTSPSVSLAEAQADARGRFAIAEVELPGPDDGNRTVVVQGEVSGVLVQRTFGVVGYSPWVVLDRYAVKPGETIGFSGHDFAPGETVRVHLDDARSGPLAEVRANDRGEVAVESILTTKPEDVGRHRLIFAPSASGSNLQVDFEVLAYTPRMELTSYAGRPGARVAFDGQGFAPNETIRAYIGDASDRVEVSSFQAGPKGEFSHEGEFVVPVDVPSGPLLLTLEGEVSKVSVSQRFSILESEPWGGLSSYVGPTGTRVTVRAEGFAAHETVGVYLDGSQERLAAGETDILGATDIGPITIPRDAADTMTFVLRGEQSGAEVRVGFRVVP